MKLEFVLNEEPVTVEVPKTLSLLDLLRDELGLTGTKRGCEIGQCGACSVLVNGVLTRACVTSVREIVGCTVTTIEGIHAPDGGPNDLQQAFLDHGATQCGYCTPGMVIAGEALLLRTLTPTRAEIREAINGNLCRCTGYQQIVDAIQATAERRRRAQQERGGTA
ncbi:MAG: (2Fe-2S)-binding protein [Anaerolineae bacterium]